MRSLFRWLGTLSALPLLGAPVTATAAPSGSGGGFALRAVVPVVCRLDRTPAGDGVVRVEEFCNSPHGYRVVARHAPGVAVAGLAFEYGGRVVPADADGETLLLDSPTAARASRDLRILSGGDPAPAVSLFVLPK